MKPKSVSLTIRLGEKADQSCEIVAHLDRGSQVEAEPRHDSEIILDLSLGVRRLPVDQQRQTNVAVEGGAKRSVNPSDAGVIGFDKLLPYLGHSIPSSKAFGAIALTKSNEA